MQSYEELIDWIRLARSEGVGTKTFRQLLQKFGSANEAIARMPEFAGKRITVIAPSVAEKEFATATKAGLAYLTWNDPAYPEALKAIEDAPPILVCKGDVNILTRPMIAMVGARNATINGKKFAKMLAADLTKAGFVVISGMARGIDGAAHEGALLNGQTVAVLAGGTDVVYPPEHKDLHARIAGNGVVLSEMPPGTEPQAALFPRRNRIISGASVGVVVVEATPKSGSLITARYAADQGRDVFAVPGSPLDPRAQGPNSLIRDGAVLVQSVNDIIDHIPVKRVNNDNFSSSKNPATQPIEKSKQNNTSEIRSIIEAALGSTLAAVDELIRQREVSPAVVAMVLTELELAGRLERLPGNRVALIGTV